MCISRLLISALVSAAVFLCGTLGLSEGNIVSLNVHAVVLDTVLVCIIAVAQTAFHNDHTALVEITADKLRLLSPAGNTNEISFPFAGLFVGKAPIITFIFNNHRLGMVRQWQELIYDCRYSQTITERGPDFVKLANANGLKGARVNTLEELEAAIQEALAEQEKGLGYVVDCNIEEKELVRPMVNGGTHITEFLVN